MTEAVYRRCSIKKVFLEILQNSQGNTCARASYFIRLQAEACNFIKKETLAQVFSCEFCKISKNTFFHRTPSVAASHMTCLKNPLSHMISCSSSTQLIKSDFSLLYYSPISTQVIFTEHKLHSNWRNSN